MIKKEELKKSITDALKYNMGKTVSDASKEDLLLATSYALRNYIMDKWIATKEQYKAANVKQMYYLSMEFLMGRALGNNIINLNAQKVIKEVFDELGIDFNTVEDSEPDAALGNGGLGRLAACFLDSIATLELPGYGCGIRYKYGIFKQHIVNGFQVESPEDWLDHENAWLIGKPEEAVIVRFGSEKQGNYEEIKAIPYDMPILGYKNNTVNTLRLWDAQSTNKFDLDSFDKGEYLKSVKDENLAETISHILYPNDNHTKGKELRIKQQYFFVSASIQYALKNFKNLNSDLSLIPEKIAFQLNDTHPSVAVAELMRILVDEEHMEWDKAWNITVRTCAYTNHTILAEALEKWPVKQYKKLLPRIYEIIKRISDEFNLTLKEKFGTDKEKLDKMSIISNEKNKQIRMAWLAIVGSHSTNGVAALHTDILKNQELKDFYEIFPDRFNNKTNGITQRRWMLLSNPELSELITNTINTDEWVKDADKLIALDKYAGDKDFQAKFLEVKKVKK